MNLKANFPFAESIIAWQLQHGRHHLPWQNTSPYATWISEIMLQQTQVETVIPYYHKFMDRFPDVATLATSPIDAVLAHWSGLGYYRRAHHLHKAAILWLDQYPDQVPPTLEAWMSLPGIGQSTAGAIMSLSLGHKTAICDANVLKVVSRFYGIDLATMPVKAKWELVASLLPAQNTKSYNQGLMDIGSMLCHRKHPNCNACPLASACVYSHLLATTPNTLTAPAKKSVKVKKTITMHVGWCLKNHHIALSQRSSAGIWPELWFLPEAHHPSCDPYRITHVLTHRLMDVSVYACSEDQLKGDYEWVAVDAIAEYPQPSLLKKILHAML